MRAWSGIILFVGCALCVGLVASCGGYGMGGYSAPPPMGTVAFTAPGQTGTVTYGQSLKLSWTTTNVVSCTGSTSSAIGGSFSGSQAVTGTATVVPTGAGTVTYTLSCVSGTGMGSYGMMTTGATVTATSTVTVEPSLLSTMTSITTIGSTLDPTEHGGNPYGLAIAPATAGLITAGDLIICNFNDGATNTQGLGTTIVGLHPVANAQPYHIAQSQSLQGCDALTLLPDDSISAAAYVANQNPLVSPTGTVASPFAADAFASPWGEAYVAAQGQNAAALYVSNADGSLDRITLNGDAQSDFTPIASGFCASGKPGAIYAPAGLTYDVSNDTLYVIDTSSNSVVAFANVSSIGAAGVVVNGQCNTVASPPTPMPTFSGPSAASVRVIAHGGPLIAPISAALLSDGDLIVGNGDVNIATGQMPNLVTEISPVLPGGFVGQPLQLDTSGTAGALFGIVATQDAHGNPVVYFNDDNTNTVMMLSRPGQ